jgi:hypothetical protein
MDRTTNLVKEILENKVLRQAITENDFCTIEKCLVAELKHNASLRSLIFNSQEREYHREDVREEIDFLNNKWNEYEPEKHIIATDEDIEHITDLYEESLGDSDDWHEHLVWALDEFEKERGEKQC